LSGLYIDVTTPRALTAALRPEIITEFIKARHCVSDGLSDSTNAARRPLSAIRITTD